MPTLPNATNIGSPGNVNLQTLSRTEVDKSDLITSQAWKEMGDNLVRTGERRMDAENRLAYQLAKNQFLELDAKVRREVQDEFEYGDWEAKYQDRMAQGGEAIIGSLRSDGDRALLASESNLTVRRGSNTMNANSFVAETSDFRSRLSENLLGMQRAYEQESSPDARTDIMLGVDKAIEAARNERYLSDEEAQTMKEASRQDFSEGWLMMLENDDLITALENPEGTPAEFLMPSRREALLKSAKEKGEAERLLIVGQQAVDEHFDPFSTYEQMRKKAATGLEGKERKAAEDALYQRYQREDAEVYEMYNRHWQAIDDAPSEEQSAMYARIPHGDLMRMSPAQKEQLKERSSGTKNTHDPMMWTSIMRMNPEQIKKLDPTKVWKNLDNSHYDKLLVMQAAVREGSSFSPDNYSTARQKLTAMVDPESTLGQALDMEFSYQMRQQETTLGRELTDGEQQMILQNLARDITMPNSTLFGLLPWGTKDVPGHMISVNDIDDDELLAVKAGLIRAGLPATDAMAVRAWLRHKLKQQYPEAVEDGE